ncbi:dynactin 1 [Cryptococcus bacillisporus CA1873]|uniref:Dynactin 1 n=1 Tax=Cryptococcus bacillisporus CA1873 TaxID=1296111 RepID=A0ABR5BHV4_CRYGA|nr:dynactin 1 [Cryptococcus bacillisporus CA1873]|eukprot:KIR68423.1 dynactin 1 [Cryptococcus gattii CA1873]
MTSQEVPIDTKVQVSAGVGYVRWTGANPGFAAGKWVGVELLEPGGKNDGSVKGERYFDCKPNHGVFVRPSQVRILEAPKSTATSRPQSMRPPATPSAHRLTSASSSRPASPQKQPTRPTAPPTPSQTLRVLSASSSTEAVAPSTAPTTGRVSSSSSSRPSQGIFKRPPSVLDERALTAATEEIEYVASHSLVSPPPGRISSPTRSVISPTPSISQQGRKWSFSSAFVAPPNPATLEQASTQPQSLSRLPSSEEEHTLFAQKRELEELRIKIRILENKKHEDQEKIRDLETRVGEADSLKAARVRLQAKFQEIQSSLLTAQRQARDLQSENSILETRAAEAIDQLEMAALDREVAEEKAEAAEADIVKLGEKVAELEMEVALLKEENAEYEKPAGGIEGERTSLAFVQLEKHNERLKEALIRLRDVSTEAERDHKVKIAELEKALTSQEDLISQLEFAEAKLTNAESQVEDLKQQLDDALGAEDMLEQLTERNLQMGERIEEMRLTIEDLEAIKELNDELEEGHVETEKQLNEEIEALTAELRKERVRSGELDALILDMETTINQFRELVASLQGELETIRLQQVTRESDTASTSKESQALMNLNLKLQSTAAKAQSKTIDLELQKLEAFQLAEHLRIVQAYLPEAYHQTEEDSTTMFLFFNRVAAKVNLLINVISQIHGLPMSLHSASSDALVGVCELIGKLHHFSTLNRRFAAIMCRGTTEAWIGYGKFIGEIGGVESRVDIWLNGLKGDEFNEGDCARDLGSLISQFDHLAETSFNHPALDAGEQQLGLAHLFDCDLDNFAAAVGFVRQIVAGLASEEDTEIEMGDSSLEERVYEPVQRILDLVRSVKIPSTKMVLQIKETVQTSSAFQPEVDLMLHELTTSVSNAVDLAVQLAQRIGQHVSTLRSTKESLRLSDIDSFLHDVTAQSASAGSNVHPWDLIAMFVSRLREDLSGTLSKIKEAAKDGRTVLESTRPWLERVASIKEAASYNVDAEKQVVKLAEEDQSLQESGMKVETLERRLEASRKQADIIIELENDVAKARKQEKVYEDAIEQLQAEQDALEAENARLRKGQGQSKDRQENGVSATPGFGGDPVIIGSGAGLESSQLAEQVESLKGAVRFLRSENALLKSRELYNDIHSLSTLQYRSEPQMPDLVPSNIPTSPSSSESSLPTTPTHSPMRSLPMTKHIIEVESRILLHQVAKFQASAKVVDISNLGGKEGWKSRKNAPELQYREWKKKEKRLEKKLEGLIGRSKELSGL